MFNILPMEANYKEGAIMREQLLETAVAAARAGARLLRERWSAPRTISRKERYDFVTDADLASQRAVLAVIEERHPDHAILAEEERGDPATAARTPGVLWVVDPLDGTTNFIHGFPMAAVSVAAVAGGRPLAGAIIDVVHGEEFKAARGLGAFVDDRPMRVADIEDRSQCLLLTGFPFRDRGRLDPYLELFKELFGQSSGVRRAGSAALDLAYVAAGRAQGFLGDGPQALGRGRGDRAGGGGRRRGQRFRRRRRSPVARRCRGRRAGRPRLDATSVRAIFSAGLSWRRGGWG